MVIKIKNVKYISDMPNDTESTFIYANLNDISYFYEIENGTVILFSNGNKVIVDGNRAVDLSKIITSAANGKAAVFE